MNNLRRLIIALIVVIILGGGIWLLTSNKNETNTNNSSQNSGPASDITITYNGSDFRLSADTIKAGGTVKVINNSQQDLDFDSDPHPVHTDNKELNAGDIAPGESKTFTVTNKGTWGFHNHANASQTGSLNVE